MTKNPIENKIYKFLINLESKVEYCLARSGKALYKPGSDIDIVISKKDLSLCFDILQESEFKVIKVVKRSYVYSVFTKNKVNEDVIQFDFEFDFDWWGLIMISASSILRNRVKNGLLWYASDTHSDYMKLLRTYLWSGKIKKEYIELGLPTIGLSSNEVEFVDSRFFVNLNESNILKICDKRYLSKIKKNITINNIKNLGFSKVLTNIFKFFYYEIRLLLFSTGFIIYYDSESSRVVDNIKNKELSMLLSNTYFKGVNLTSGHISFMQRRKLFRDLIITFKPLEKKSLGVYPRLETINGKVYLKYSRKEFRAISSSRDFIKWIMDDT